MEPYLALFEPDREAGGYVVTFPDFGYGVTQGETEQEAMEMAQDPLMLTLGDYIRESRQLPVPKRHRGSKFRRVLLPALQAAKIDLYTAFLESGLKKAEFACRVGIPKTHIECFLSGIAPVWTRSNRHLPRLANVYTSRRAAQLEAPRGLST